MTPPVAASPPPPDPRRPLDELGSRIELLERAFRDIAATRMRGVPVLHAPLQVQAVGFAPGEPGWALGVLVTPWFMNLLRLPIEPLTSLAPPSPSEDLPPSSAAAAAATCLAIGRDAPREIGGESLHFIGAHEGQVGHFEVCSLFSPMFQFADQAAAVATAGEVLRLLRNPSAPTPERRAAALPAAPETAAVPARRSFLFGRP
jgi:[NiFe] hydrogenase assembly HybE family chaperone